MSGQVKNQHYVPQMYLNRFSDNGKRINVWNIEQDCILGRQLARNYAAKRYYYDADKAQLKEALEEMRRIHPEVLNELEAGDEQFVERALGRCESDIAKVFQEIMKDAEALYKMENQQKIIIFLHELVYRTEAFRDSIDKIHKHALEWIEKLGINEEDVEGIGKDGKTTQLYQLLGLAPLFKTARSLMGNYNWYIGEVPGKMKLLISDDPAKDIGLGFNDICFLISGEKAIVFRIADSSAPILSEDIPNGNKIILSERSVFAYNAAQYSHANRFMFGDKSSLLFLKMMVDKNLQKG